MVVSDSSSDLSLGSIELSDVCKRKYSLDVLCCDALWWFLLLVFPCADLAYGMAWGELYFWWSVFLLRFWILWLLGYTVTTLYGFVSKHGSMVMFLDVIFTNTDSPGCMIASFALLFLSMCVLRYFLYCASLWSILDGSEVLDLYRVGTYFDGLQANSVSDGGVRVTECAVVQ